VLYLKQARRTHEEAFTHERSISILREAEAGAMPIKALCKKHNITDQAFFRWRNKLAAGTSRRSCEKDIPVGAARVCAKMLRKSFESS